MMIFRREYVNLYFSSHERRTEILETERERLKECFNREPFQFVDDDLSLASFSLSFDVEHASKELKGTGLGETGMGSLQNDRKALRAFSRRIRGPLERFLERLDALKDRRNFVEARL